MRTETLEAVGADIDAAIDRLLKGTPTNPKLIEIALAGKLHINASTISLESGRSRTYFGYKDCPLPDRRRRILELRTSSARVVAYKELVRRLLAQIEELECTIRVKDTALAAMIVASAQNGMPGKELSDEMLDYRRNREIRRSKPKLP